MSSCRCLQVKGQCHQLAQIIYLPAAWLRALPETQSFNRTLALAHVLQRMPQSTIVQACPCPCTAALYELRDVSCRQLDESTGYIMPRAQLLKLAQAMPKTQPGALCCAVLYCAVLCCGMVSQVGISQAAARAVPCSLLPTCCRARCYPPVPCSLLPT